MRGFLLLAAASVIAGCIDFREGLACGSDADCLGYLCLNSVCQAAQGEESPGGGGGSPGAGDGTAIIAAGQKNAVSLRQDGTTLYWLAEDGGRLKIRKGLKTGTTSADVADLGPWSSSSRPAMAIGDDALYVAAGKKLFKATKTGGAPTVLATSPGPDYGGGLGLAGTTLVWLSPNGGSDAVVWKMPISGGTPEQVSANEFGADELVAAGSFAYWRVSDGIVVYDMRDGSELKATGIARGLRATATHVTWLERPAVNYIQPTTIVFTQPGDTGTTTYDLEMPLYAAASDGADTLYAIGAGLNDSDTTLLRVNRAGGSSSSVKIPDSAVLKTEIEVDATNIYIIEHDQILRRAR